MYSNQYLILRVLNHWPNSHDFGHFFNKTYFIIYHYLAEMLLNEFYIILLMHTIVKTSDSHQSNVIIELQQVNLIYKNIKDTYRHF